MVEKVNGILKTKLISDSYPDLKAAMQHLIMEHVEASQTRIELLAGETFDPCEFKVCNN